MFIRGGDHSDPQLKIPQARKGPSFDQTPPPWSSYQHWYSPADSCRSYLRKSRHLKTGDCPLIAEKKMSLTPEEQILTDLFNDESDELFWHNYPADHRTFINHYLDEAF